MLDWQTSYPSRRSPVFAANTVATTQPLATQAGLRMMLRGGNAVDAAVATAIALTVVEPTMNGIGSDAFAIVHDGNKTSKFANPKTFSREFWVWQSLNQRRMASAIAPFVVSIGSGNNL